MKNLSHLFVVIGCFALSLNGPALGQDTQSVYTKASDRTVTSEGVLVAEIDARLAELLEEHWANIKSLTLKDPRHYHGGEIQNWGSLNGYASSPDTSATTSKKSKSGRRLTGAVIGGAIGAMGGLLLYEIGTGDIGLCSEGDPGCTTTTSGPSHGATMAIFGGVGAVVGFLVGG
jgi:hypothetical protein